MPLTTDPAERDLLTTVCANPDDTAPRLILADWYDEREEDLKCYCTKVAMPWADKVICPRCQGQRYHSNGLAARAAFVRTQMTMEPLTYNHHMNFKLAFVDTNLLYRWSYRFIKNGGHHLVFNKGFIEEVTLAAWWWERLATDVLAEHPLRRVVFEEYPIVGYDPSLGDYVVKSTTPDVPFVSAKKWLQSWLSGRPHLSFHYRSATGAVQPLMGRVE